MGVLQKILGVLAGLALLETVYAGLDLSSNSTVVVYWGQNSFAGTGDLAQQRLGYYCDDSNIDVIVLAFLMTINGPGGAPEIDFANQSSDCKVFPGTNLKNCPDVGEDIQKCQSKGKTIILSIGGATYSEGGFSSKSAADTGADLIWATFGPDTGDSTVHRPFGKAVIDGFDFDFEATVQYVGEFATKLRALADKDTSKKYYLTAAPQCPYPDAADKDILNTDASAAIDAVFVQFYNNYCGVNAFTAARKMTNLGHGKHSRGLSRVPYGATAQRTAAQTNFNFDVWDKWALTVSKNKNVRVFLGVPANTGAAATGYLPASSLAPVIAYSKGFESFGGVMMWDVSQEHGNKGFLDGVRSALGGKTHGSSSPTSPPQEEDEEPASSPSPSPVTKPSHAEEADDEQETQDQTTPQQQTSSSASSSTRPSPSSTPSSSTFSSTRPSTSTTLIPIQSPSSTPSSSTFSSTFSSTRPSTRPSTSSTLSSTPSPSSSLGQPSQTRPQTQTHTQTQTHVAQSSASTPAPAPAEPSQGQSTGEQPQNQDSDGDQDRDGEGKDKDEKADDQDQPLDLLHSLLGNVDLDFLHM